MQDTDMASAEKDEEMLVQREESGAGGGERQIQIHPLVIVNIADHQTRQQLSQTEAPQVIGALFGIQKGLDVAVYDSFEMKYDVANGEIQIDKEFLTSRIQQFSQVFPGFELLGWYTVGAKALPSDLAVHRVVMEFNESPLFMILDPESKGPSTKKKLPISLFESELHVLNGVPKMIFVKAPFKIETSETEGIAIDHISKIAPIGDASKSTLHPYLVHPYLGNVRDAVKMLDRQVDVLLHFLQAMKNGEAPLDHNLLRHISSICNQLPAMKSEHFDAAFTQEYNDALLVSYLATLTKGATNANTVVDRFSVTQERHHQRGTLL
ncbi:COP9 signalosome complex subunit [Phytophthora megakarya]|uniref:COP9 signalosome complex subunit 6 n=1 Tax=Phytophthora megakarya TaxID=4795 RepID=A0A225X3G8_9STRA|nr:COP9 signalosome complex subunit [Phytophthora megakarya]